MIIVNNIGSELNSNATKPMSNYHVSNGQNTTQHNPAQNEFINTTMTTRATVFSTKR